MPFAVTLKSLHYQLLEIRYSQLDMIHHLLGPLESIGWPKALTLLSRGSEITEGHDDDVACTACKIPESPTPLPQNSCSPFCLCADDCSCLNAEARTRPNSEIIPSVHKNPLDPVHQWNCSTAQFRVLHPLYIPTFLISKILLMKCRQRRSD